MAKKSDKVTWFELPADDTVRASKFYGEVFGWTTSEMGGGSLYAQTAPSDENTVPLERGAINGDISPRSPEFDKPLIVITVEDVSAKIAMVKQAGGNVVLDRKEVVEMGIIWAIISDTEGNKVGIIQNM
jgi:hypothetical protein